MLKRLWEEEVVPLLKCRCYVWTCLFGLALAYGFYLMHFSISKDVLIYTEVGPATSAIFLGAAQMRWGMGVLAQVVGFHSWSLYVSCLVGFTAWFFAATFLVAQFNRLLAVRNPVYSAFFAILTVTPLWGVEILTYPYFPVYIGVGALSAVLGAVEMFAYLKDGQRARGLCATLWVALCMANYEAIVSFCLVAFLMLLLVDVWRSGTELFAAEMYRRYIVLVGILAVGAVSKIAISMAIVKAGDMLFGVRFSGDGAATEILWLEQGFSGGITMLLRNFGYGFVLRALTCFATFSFVVSTGAFLIWAGCLARHCRRNSILLLAFAVCVAFFAIPLLQGHLFSLRVLVPACAFFVAFDVYLLQFVPWWRGVLPGLAGLGVFLHVSNLTVSLNDVVVRYEFDKHHALMMIHDLKQQIGETEKPIVFVGSIFAERAQKRHTGAVYPMQRDFYAFGLERYQSIQASNGGWAGQGTILAPTWWAKGREFYRFINLLGGFGINRPDPETEAIAEAYVVQNDMPAYPDLGYIVEAEKMVIVNLGIPAQRKMLGVGSAGMEKAPHGNVSEGGGAEKERGLGAE